MIQRQEIFNIVDLFTSQPLIDFYQTLFDCIDLSSIPEFIQSKRGPIGYSRHALTRAFIVMNCEHFREITLLRDFLYSNLKIAQLCGFDITKKLPSYSVFQRHIKNIENSDLKEVMKSQVKTLIKLGAINNEIVSVDSTPIKANTKYNNPKCFSKNKFSKDNPPKSDKDCKLGVHTANNEDTDKNYEFYWGYKNLIMCDAKSGLPIYEVTLTGEQADVSNLINFLDKIYCCPFRTSKDDSKCPCNHPKYNNGHKNRGCVKYKSIGTDYRASVDETSDYFKFFYSMRTESERYNSRFKNLNLETPSVRNMRSIENQNTLGHICLLAVALAAILTNKGDMLRSLSNLKRAS